MTIIHTTPTGAKVRLSARHAALLAPEDVVQQNHFMELGSDGHDADVQREVAAAVGKAKLHMDNVAVAIRLQMGPPRCCNTEADVEPEDWLETMVRRPKNFAREWAE